LTTDARGTTRAPVYLANQHSRNKRNKTWMAGTSPAMTTFCFHLRIVTIHKSSPCKPLVKLLRLELQG
jgi:hypothetical protein